MTETMSAGVGAEPTVIDQPSTGPASMNLHGSVATRDVDTNFEPNFRHFDCLLEDTDAPDAGVAERVMGSPAGGLHSEVGVSWMQNIRCTPVIFTSLLSAIVVNYLYTGLMSKSHVSMRWGFWKCYAVMLVYNNFVKFYARERYFNRDFQRNQMFSMDEVRTQRDRQRVREALYEKNFVTNPVAEYRIKAWQVADRFA